ncbi:hypothetical protein PIB30_094717, partial [Stylosanthes scabra]|nr:hypothetical protein [Stylosanthes scabra]
MPLFAGSTAVPRRAVATPFVSSSLLVSSMSLLLCSCSRAFVLVSLLVLPAPPCRAAVSVGAPFLCSCFTVQALLPASPFSVVPSILCLIFPVLCLSKSPFSHHSNLLSWRQSLAEVVEIGLDDEGLLDMDALKLQLEAYKHTNRPLLGSFSACSNVTGIHSDTRAIACLLHQYNCFACFDFAASGPYVEIDIRSGHSN